MRTVLGILITFLIVAVPGCGGDDDDDSGSAGAGGSAATGGSAGSLDGGAGTGGTSGMGGTDGAGGTVHEDGGGVEGGTAGEGGSGGEGGWQGYIDADYCSPGLYAFRPDEGCFDAEGEAALAAGVRYDGLFMSMGSAELPVAMTAGEPYAVTLELRTPPMNPPDWQVELYGVMSRCAIEGGTADLLATIPLDRGGAAYCADMLPEKDYPHLLVAHHSTREFAEILAYDGIRFCPNVTCPVR